MFENRTGDDALASVGQLVAERIITTMAGVTGVQVLPRPVIMGTGAPAKSAASKDELSAPLQVTGTYHVRQGVLEFHARILDATTGGLLHAVASDTGTHSLPADGLQLIAQRVAGAVAIHFDDFFGGLHAVSHVPTLDAYREYRAGLEIFWSDYDRAMAHLERALAKDPAFLHGQLIMFFAHANLGESEKSELILERMEAAWDRLTPAERLLVEFLRAQREGRRAQALRLLYDLETLVPSSLFVNSNLVSLSVLENRPHAAVVAYDRRHFVGRTLRHSIDSLRQDFLMEALHMLGDYDRELEQAKLAQQYAPGDLRQLEAEARALVAIGRVADVTNVINRCLSMTPLAGPPHTPGEVMEGVAREFRAHGYQDESIELARRAVEWYRSRPADIAASETNRAGLARAVYLTERWEEADALFSALSVETRDDVGYLGYLGAIAARTNDAPRARGIAARLARVTGRVTVSRANYERVRIAALLQERQLAVDLLRDALTLGLGYTGSIHSDLDLESLRDYPPFVELVRPRG
jgi:tetratricopeptide (TPR) repeat protein